MTAGVGGVQRPGEAEAVEAAVLFISGYSKAQWERWRDTSRGQRWHDMTLAAVREAYPIIAAAVEVLAYERAAETIEAARAEAMSRATQAAIDVSEQSELGWRNYADGLGDAADAVRGLLVSPVEREATASEQPWSELDCNYRLAAGKCSAPNGSCTYLSGPRCVVDEPLGGWKRRDEKGRFVGLRCGVTWVTDGELHECLFRHPAGCYHQCDCGARVVSPVEEGKQR